MVRVEGGIDHYVAIAGHYLRSSFGCPSELVVTPPRGANPAATGTNGG